MSYQMYYDYPPVTYLEYPILVVQGVYWSLDVLIWIQKVTLMYAFDLCVFPDVVVLLLILHYNRNLKHVLIYAAVYPSSSWSSTGSIIGRIVPPKMKILTSFSHPHVISHLYDLTLFVSQHIKKYIFKTVVNWHQFTCIGFVSIQLKSMGVAAVYTFMLFSYYPTIRENLIDMLTSFLTLIIRFIGGWQLLTVQKWVIDLAMVRTPNI